MHRGNTIQHETVVRNSDANRSASSRHPDIYVRLSMELYMVNLIRKRLDIVIKEEKHPFLVELIFVTLGRAAIARHSRRHQSRRPAGEARPGTSTY
jgi:hypothetical protein